MTIYAKSLFRLFLANFAVLCLLLGGVEIVLRILGIGFGNNPMEASDIFHHVHPADYRFTSYSESGSYEWIDVYYDPNRMVASPRHNPLPKDNFEEEVVFLGDSFIESLQVPFDSGLVGRLQRDFPNTKMLNFGASGYSPAIYYLQVKHLILTRQILPSKAFIFLYSNDIEDDKTYLKNAVYDDRGDLFAIDGGKKKWLISLLKHSYLARWIRKTQIRWRYWLSHRHESKKTVGNLVEEFLDFENTESAFYAKKTLDLLDDHGIQTYLTAIPSKYCHYNNDYSEPSFAEKVRIWAFKNDIPFIDFEKHFRAWAAEREDKLFFEKDIHFNAAGHRLVAEILKPSLLSPPNIEH